MTAAKVYTYQAVEQQPSSSSYHVLDASLEQRLNGQWRCLLVETWGSVNENGDREERGRYEAIGRGPNPGDAVTRADVTAREMPMTTWLIADVVSHIQDQFGEDEPAGPSDETAVVQRIIEEASKLISPNDLEVELRFEPKLARWWAKVGDRNGPTRSGSSPMKALVALLDAVTVAGRRHRESGQ